MSRALWITIVETEVFAKHASKVLSDEEAERLNTILAVDPEMGKLVPGGGGIRKLRLPAKGKGKRGGARVIYYYFDESVPVYLLDVYAKNEKADLDKDDLTALAEAMKGLAAAAKKKRR